MISDLPKIAKRDTQKHIPNMYLFEYRQIMIVLLLGSLAHISALKVSSKPPLLPPKATAAKLFLFGSTVGPLVDSLHNQCLLEYDMAPITIQNPISSSAPPLLCTSWAVPPLLGIAYLILGYILPRVIELVSNVKVSDSDDNATTYYDSTGNNELKNKAILAVTSTAGIIKLSEFLQTHEFFDAKTNLEIMAASDLLQWIVLDGTPVALVASCVVGVGGPLSELPFVAHGFWHYIPQSADYIPLENGLNGISDSLATTILGDGYRDLALSSITGPCYFAVAMDSIALSRYFYSSEDIN